MAYQIRNLKQLKGGTNKYWPLKDKKQMPLLNNYFQKISYCVQDLESEFEGKTVFSRKDVVYIILLITWIEEAFRCAQRLYRKDVMARFSYEGEAQLKQYKDYLHAMRSFVTAHPLTTTQHKKFGLDGDFICVDIRPFGVSFPLIRSDRFYHLGIGGMKQGRIETDDFYLYAYSGSQDGMKYFYFIGCSMDDLVTVVNGYIDKIYAFDKYLNRQKQSYFRKESK